MPDYETRVYYICRCVRVATASRLGAPPLRAYTVKPYTVDLHAPGAWTGGLGVPARNGLSVIILILPRVVSPAVLYLSRIPRALVRVRDAAGLPLALLGTWIGETRVCWDGARTAPRVEVPNGDAGVRGGPRRAPRHAAHGPGRWAVANHAVCSMAF